MLVVFLSVFLRILFFASSADAQAASKVAGNPQKNAVHEKNSGDAIRANRKLKDSARELLISEKYEEAIELLNRAIQLAPSDYEAYSWRSRAFGRSNQIKKALFDAERAVVLDPNHLAALDAKLACLYRLGQYEKAVQVADVAAKKLPHCRWIYSYRGRALCCTGRYALAIPDLSRVLEEFSNSSEALIPLGLAEAGVGDESAALNSLESISKLSRRSLRLTISPAKSEQHDIQLYRAALRNFDDKIRLQGKTCKNLFARAFANFILEKYSQSVEDCTQAIKLNPKLCPPRILRAYGNLALKQQKLAREEIETVISMAPEADSSYAALIHLHFYDGSYLQSIEDLSQKLKSSSRPTPILVARGQIFVESNRHEEALADFNRALEFNPSRTDALAARAEIYQALSHFDQAIADFSKAILLQPNCPIAAYKGRAACYMELHLYNKAVDDLSKLIACSHSARPYFARSICWTKLGQPERALADKRAAESFQSIETMSTFAY